MSDFLFSSERKPKGHLLRLLKRIYQEEERSYFEFHGSWGSLACVDNHYPGFNPYESKRHLLIVIGGPIIKIPNANRTDKNPGCKYTKLIYERWKQQNKIDWKTDISGPFTIICIDKNTPSVEIVTGMLSSIPVFFCSRHKDNTEEVYFGTHIDTLASLTENLHTPDYISIADLLINRSIAYPYTPYEGINELAPASVSYKSFYGKSDIKSTHYWLPVEENPFRNINEAAGELRNAIIEEINNMCSDKALSVGVLLSGGEDSRIILSALPPVDDKKAITFLNEENLEGRIAHTIADRLDTEYSPVYQPAESYISQIESRAALIGSQYDPVHGHVYGVHNNPPISSADIVLGGYAADAHFKANSVPYKFKFGGIKIGTQAKKQFEKSDLIAKDREQKFRKNIIAEIVERRKNHFRKIKSIRQESAYEWYTLWPLRMRVGAGYFMTNRRLFRSYEPFLGSAPVQLASVIPTQWKINRKLFHRAMKPLLKQSRMIPHIDGHLPYFDIKTSLPVRLFIKLILASQAKLKGKSLDMYRAFPDWNSLLYTDVMHTKMDAYRERTEPVIQNVFRNPAAKEVWSPDKLALHQILSIIQFSSNRALFRS